MAATTVPNDPTIDDDWPLWRRVPRWWCVPDENQGGVLRPSSAAFEDSPDGTAMSVVLGPEAHRLGRGPLHMLEGHPEFAVATLTAGTARQHGQGVIRDPLPEDPAHGLVHGPKPKSIRRKLAAASVWLVPPPP